MIDPTEPLEVQVTKQAKIIDALISRSERGHEVGGSAYSLFQSAIALQAAVWEKTKDLEHALDTLGRASTELEHAQRSQEQMQKTLADAMIAMEGGFALFSEERLQVCNDLFRHLLPDVEPIVEPGLPFDDYVRAVEVSRYLSPRDKKRAARVASPMNQPYDRRFSSQVVALKNDRWFQISYRQTTSGNIVVLQTEISEIVRQNRREKDRLIDQHAQFLQAAFDHMPLGVCTFSAAGELLVRNERFGELLGVPLSLLEKGTDFRRIVEYVERYEVLLPQHADGGRALGDWAKELRRCGVVHERFRRPDGVALDMQIHTLPDAGLIVSIMDVTVETEAAETRQRINETLERRVEERTAELTEANRLLRIRSQEQANAEEALLLAKEAAEGAHMSKTRFLAAASHDLLQPINAAKLYISTLKEKVTQPAAADTVERLGRSFASMESLLHALLDISRLDSPAAEFSVTSFCLDGPMRSLEADLLPLAVEKGIGLKVLPSTRWVASDQRYLMRCLQNLVVNAIQYTETGRVLVGCRIAGASLLVEVWDTGIGISEADQTRIFNEFTRVKETRSASGVGLGLSIVERACRHLGHRVNVHSTLGKGSVFSIEVPLAQPGIKELSDVGTVDAEPRGALDLIVMIVENDADVLHATTQQLHGWGAGVLGVASTQEALETMASIGTPPDIILADYQLDDGDTGVETIRALRQAAGAEIPAIVITANRSRSLHALGAEMSFSVLTKPVQLSRLRALIDWKTRRRAA
ncbi:Autoinducer 2 sensor kinase/phosphatase LuxQ [Defluviimonas aquaemixtae]|uniref:histidine kinase n=1 Tax=Albidovulum aquaemixtae TaxID=1542388 RepID=A0A2R8BNX3_9RHOB|nr:PAS-domain containing protein [Defluviimonas aquaemixtae]SPH25149.1 Autoinducer 2 sensor kinase/phosphatase LuxQ [Defluviimonas aquaemixtae]